MLRRTCLHAAAGEGIRADCEMNVIFRFSEG